MTSPIDQGEALAALAADAWVVVAYRYGSSIPNHYVGQLQSKTEKMAHVKVGPGRRIRRIRLDDIVPCASEEAARHLCQALDGARGEALRRQSAAVNAYKEAAGKLYVRALREHIQTNMEGEARG